MHMKKLVRDRIPEVIKKAGNEHSYFYYVASNDEYKVKLREKLTEEVNEFLAEETPEEIADILEVIDALCVAYGFTKEGVYEAKEQKFSKRGGFKEKIILVQHAL